jgi:hypothetical protein
MQAATDGIATAGDAGDAWRSALTQPANSESLADDEVHKKYQWTCSGTMG